MKDIDRHFIGRLGSKMGYFAYVYAEMRRKGLDYNFPHSPHLYYDYIAELKQMFSDGITGDDRVAVHIRRGDFLVGAGAVVNGVLPCEYYELAVAHFPDSRFLLFTAGRLSEEQDREARTWGVHLFNQIAHDRFDVWDSDDGLQDFNKMAGCSHIIIANSTFSMWAGLINPHDDAKIIYPLQWGVSPWKPTMPQHWIGI